MARLQSRRKTNNRNYRTQFVLAVEGKTEKAYFEQFKGHISEVQLMVNTGKGSNPTAVMAQADRMLEDLRSKGSLRAGDQAWCVIDRDEWEDDQIQEIWSWASQRGDRGIALSLPQFEWWLLLHFEDGTGAGTRKEIIDRLNRYIPDYQKGSSSQLPNENEQHKEAIRRAKKKIPSELTNFEDLKDLGGSWTTVHLLTEKIINAIQASSAANS